MRLLFQERCLRTKLSGAARTARKHLRQVVPAEREARQRSHVAIVGMLASRRRIVPKQYRDLATSDGLVEMIPAYRGCTW